MPAPHPPEFRQRAVELARVGDKRVAEVARDLGISDQRVVPAELDGPGQRRREWQRQAVDQYGEEGTRRAAQEESAA